MDKDLLKLLENPNVGKYNHIARELMTNFGIRKRNSLTGEETIYKFKEIEFYLYDKFEHPSDDRTYDRDTRRGEWFFHPSGVDISFDTIKDSDEYIKFGGILIRGIEVIVDGQSKWVIGGPKLCMYEIFNNTRSLPEIIKLPEGMNAPLRIKKCKRHNVEGPSKDEISRYFDPDVDWEKPRPKFKETEIGNNWKVTLSLLKSNYDAAPVDGEVVLED